MPMSPTRHRSRLALIFGINFVALLATSRLALAADSSPWDGTERAAVRLIAGGQHEAGGTTVLRAGVEIRLAPGWKTYWRYPGDSGVPPRFDFSRSQNVKAVTMRWPAPQRLADEGGTSIGYKHDVLFPLDVVPQDAGKPAVLALGIDYAVCEKLCVPADGKAELTITGKASANVARHRVRVLEFVAPARMRVPASRHRSKRFAGAIVRIPEQGRGPAFRPVF